MRDREVVPSFSVFQKAILCLFLATLSCLTTSALGYPAYTLSKGQWSLISIPADPGDSGTLGNLFSDDLPIDSYGAQGSWVVYGYNAAARQYAQVATDEVLSANTGYWIIQLVADSVELDIPDTLQPLTPNADTACLEGSQCAKHPLVSADGSVVWNLVGYSSSREITYGDSRFLSQGGACFAGCSPDEARAVNVAHNVLYRYNPGNTESPYERVTADMPLRAWDGYWLAMLPDAAATEWVLPLEIDLTSNECNDGIDNDGDGWTDWQFDLGCSSESDTTERALAREFEDGWTTFDKGDDSRVYYLSSSEGDDSNDGLSPETPKKTIAAVRPLLREGYPDFLLFKRGDTWRDEFIDRRGWNNGSPNHLMGRSPEEKMVIASYGDSQERPVIEFSDIFYNDNGSPGGYVAFVGLKIVGYRYDYSSADFTGDGGYVGIRIVSSQDNTNKNWLVEDSYFKHAEIVFQNSENVEIRRNIVYRAYATGTCLFNSDGSLNKNGDPGKRPSGLFAGDVNKLNLTENIWIENGWNPDVPKINSDTNGSCATIYNHNIYLANVKNASIFGDIYIGGSSMNVKVSGTTERGVDGLTIQDSIFSDGEIGVGAGGNGRMFRSHMNVDITNNYFLNIGRNRPTDRRLAWPIVYSNHDTSIISDNVIAHTYDGGNSFGVFVESHTPDLANVEISNNIFYGNPDEDIELKPEPNWRGVAVTDNTFYSPNQNNNRDIIRFNNGSQQGVTVGTNEYEYSATDPNRNIDSYAEYLGIGDSVGDFSDEARKQSKFNWRQEYTSRALFDYLDAGYRN